MTNLPSLARAYPKQIVIAIAAFLVVSAILYWLIAPEKHPVPADMTNLEKKARFMELMLPVITKVHSDLESEFLSAKRAMKAGKDLGKLREEYRAESDQQLLAALKPHPVSIVLAQAAIESAWATSRFFEKANNVFGVWSFDPDEPRIAAGTKRGDQTVYVKRYRSLDKAVRDYYRILARGDSYSEFRKLRLDSDDPFTLVTRLDGYSEKGARYGEDLATIIRRNEFQQYD